MKITLFVYKEMLFGANVLIYYKTIYSVEYRYFKIQH